MLYRHNKTHFPDFEIVFFYWIVALCSLLNKLYGMEYKTITRELFAVKKWKVVLQPTCILVALPFCYLLHFTNKFLIEYNLRICDTKVT